MKTPDSNPDDRWNELIERARGDIAPPANVSALLRAMRTAQAEPTRASSESWATEFFALFASGRVMSACLAGAAGFAAIASWQAWETWQTLPWAQLIAVTPGGAS